MEEGAQGKEEFTREFGKDYGYPDGPRRIDEIRASEFKRLNGATAVVVDVEQIQEHSGPSNLSFKKLTSIPQRQSGANLSGEAVDRIKIVKILKSSYQLGLFCSTLGSSSISRILRYCLNSYEAMSHRYGYGYGCGYGYRYWFLVYVCFVWGLSAAFILVPYKDVVPTTYQDAAFDGTRFLYVTA
ncbi:Molybdenum cofactor sulfurase [Nymphaea thermarum]|nr:Molybdenum cofactor sulfurase [Nymphaea thermarum]